MSQANIQHTTVTMPVPHVLGELEHVGDGRRYVLQTALSALPFGPSSLVRAGYTSYYRTERRYTSTPPALSSLPTPHS